MPRRRIGIVGYGRLGRHLADHVLRNGDLFELAFVWNRTAQVLEGNIDETRVLKNLLDFPERKCDLIVEVAHPCIAHDYGQLFLQHADFMVGSPSALADRDLESGLRDAASSHGLYVPRGAFWGAEDVRTMADAGTLQGLTVTMSKSPDSFKLVEPLKSKNDLVKDSPVVLFEGPVRELCPLAPNNVNTMAVGAIAASNLGFDGVKGRLVSDPGLTGWHVIEIEAVGVGPQGRRFSSVTVRRNPSDRGAVTGSATFATFAASMLGAHGRGGGVHIC